MLRNSETNVSNFSKGNLSGNSFSFSIVACYFRGAQKNVSSVPIDLVLHEEEGGFVFRIFHSMQLDV